MVNAVVAGAFCSIVYRRRSNLIASGVSFHKLFSRFSQEIHRARHSRLGRSDPAPCECRAAAWASAIAISLLKNSRTGTSAPGLRSSRYMMIPAIAMMTANTTKVIRNDVTYIPASESRAICPRAESVVVPS